MYFISQCVHVMYANSILLTAVLYFLCKYFTVLSDNKALNYVKCGLCLHGVSESRDQCHAHLVIPRVLGVAATPVSCLRRLT